MDAAQKSRSHESPRESGGALTDAADWDSYYEGLDVSRLDTLSRLPSVFDTLLSGRTGSVFELGCGGSPLLARCARAGWSVSGVDFSKPSLVCLERYLTQHQLAAGNFLCGDIFQIEPNELSESVDFLVSAGFLEHFKNPAPILKKWSTVLKADGQVISAIPNLLGANARVFAHYDPVFWNQHVVFDPAAVDQMHVDAGLRIVQKAQYLGRYDIHMLIPWTKISARFPHPQLYRLFKLATYFGIGLPLSRLPLEPSRRLAPYIVGVYALSKRSFSAGPKPSA